MFHTVKHLASYGRELSKNAWKAFFLCPILTKSWKCQKVLLVFQCLKCKENLISNSILTKCDYTENSKNMLHRDQQQPRSSYILLQLVLIVLRTQKFVRWGRQ
jgi:hypothetical protein